MATNYWKVKKGISLDTSGASTVSAEGDLSWNGTAHKLEFKDNAATRSIVAEDATQTLTNKTLDAASNTISNLVDANIKAAAAIAYSKLSLTGNIVNADIAAAAAIARSKVAAGTASQVLINDVSGNLSSEAQLAGTRGGTGVSNSGSLTFGANPLTLTTSGSTTVTLPTTGTLSTLAGVETLSNKTFSDSPVLTQIATPANPSSGFNKIYPKSDGNLYTLNSAGIEKQIGSGSGGTKNYLGTVNNVNGNGDFELGSTSGWSLANTALSSLIPTTVSNPGAALAGAQYIFTITSGNATAGATYTNNTQTFTVVNTIAAQTTLVCTGTGSPTASGTLTKATGTGDATITFSAFKLTAASANLSLAVVSSGQLSGKYSGSLSSSAVSTAGDLLLSNAFTLDLSDQTGRVLGWSFNYEVVSGAANLNLSGTSSNSHAIYLYDVTNAKWVQPAGVYNLVQSSGVGKAYGTVQLDSTCTSVQLAVVNVNASAGAYTLYVDDFSVGPQVAVQAPAMSDVQSYSGTIGGTTTAPTLGTIVRNEQSWSRSGDKLHVHWDVEQSSAGTAGSGVYTFPLPSGIAIDTSKYSGSTSATIGTAHVTVGGVEYTGVVQFRSSTALQLLVGNDTNVPSAVSSSYLGASNTTVAYTFDVPGVPIVGWSSNTVSSADTDTRVCAARRYSVSNNLLADSTTYFLDFEILSKDTHGAFTGAGGGVTTTFSSSCRYIAPLTGFYVFTASVTFTGLTAGVGRISLDAFLNGTDTVRMGDAAITSTQQSCVGVTPPIYLNAGDAVAIGLSQNNGGARNTGGGIITQEAGVFRLSGPAVVQATESVNMRYTSTSTSALTQNTRTAFTFGTKDYDSHNSYSGGIYTVPVSGKYRFSASLSMSPVTAANFTTATQWFLEMFNSTQSKSIQGPIVWGNGASAEWVGTVNGTLSCNAGDQLQLKYFLSTFTNGGAPNGTITTDCIEIERVGN